MDLMESGAVQRVSSEIIGVVSGRLAELPQGDVR